MILFGYAENYYDYDEHSSYSIGFSSSSVPVSPDAPPAPPAAFNSPRVVLTHDYDDAIAFQSPELLQQSMLTASGSAATTNPSLAEAMVKQAEEDALLRQYLSTMSPSVRALLETLALDTAQNRNTILKQAAVSALNSASVEKKDWNAEFQDLLAQEDSEMKFRDLYHLAHDFVYAAKSYAKIIISELLLPSSQKTIQPAALGGVAGGTKFCVQNILFKFVLDFELKPGLWMYGGDQRSDENGSSVRIVASFGLRR